MVKRRLAAILAADVVGYSRLMGADEEGALEALQELREKLFDPAIANHGGRIVKLMGDGTLVEFASVVDAVNCGAEIQGAMAENNAGVNREKRLDLRIGINLGDVMIEGDDIYGDGVNLAARLEAEAQPGGICVSQVVVDQTSGKVSVGFEDLGEKSLKNIEGPVRVFRVVAEGAPTRLSPPRRRRLTLGGIAVVLISAFLAGGWFLTRPTPASAISAERVMTVEGPTIAALPFENHSGDAGQDLFARGMSDQLVAALTRFNGVRVLSPRASVKYADDFAALRRELGADYLLDGNIRRGAEKIQITAALTKVGTGTQIWTDTFEAEISPTNLVEIQDRLAGQIAGAIADDSRGIALLDRVADQPVGAPNDQDSLDCVSGWKLDMSEVGPALYQCLMTAIELDPRYAGGWTRLSRLYIDSYVGSVTLADDPIGDLQPLMLEAARKAVELAPNSANARSALAEAYYYNDDQAQFLAEVAKVLELNPNDAGNIAWLGTSMAFSGNWDEGGALIERAMAFNPSVVNPRARYGLAKAHYLAGEYAEALEDFQHIWTAWDGYWINDLNRAYLYADWGKQEEAEMAAAALMNQLPDFVIEDAVDFYRLLRFQDSYIEKMVLALKKAGLPSRGDS